MRMRMCAKNALYVGFLRGVTYERNENSVETIGEYFTHIVSMEYMGTTTIKLGLLLKHTKQWKIQINFEDEEQENVKQKQREWRKRTFHIHITRITHNNNNNNTHIYNAIRFIHPDIFIQFTS